MLDLYRWQREQALTSEQMERRNRHAYVMEKDHSTHESPVRERLAEKLHALAFHLAPNAQWSREAASEPAV